MSLKTKINLNILKDSPERDNIRFIKEIFDTLFDSDGSCSRVGGVRWQGFEITLDGATSAGEIPHTLSGVPTDALVTWLEWTSVVGTFSWLYPQFTAQKAVFSCTQPALIRGIIGRR